MTRRDVVARPGETVPTVFARGALVTGLLSAIQDRRGPDAAPLSGRNVLRHALQGGAALAAGTVAAEALSRHHWRLALGALAAGAVGVLAAEALLNPSTKETIRGQEV